MTRPHLLLVISIGDSEETLSEKNLELLDKEVLRVVDTDEGADDIARSVGAKVYRIDQG
jgi:hypothetical protein